MRKSFFLALAASIVLALFAMEVDLKGDLDKACPGVAIDTVDAPRGLSQQTAIDPFEPAAPAAGRDDLPEPYFVDVAAETGVAGIEAGNAVTFGDINGDGYDDVILHERGEWERDLQWVLLNVEDPEGRGGRIVENATESSNFCSNRDPEISGRVSSMVAFADVDNDGDVDVFSGAGLSTGGGGGILDRNELMLNDGTGRFEIAENSSLNTAYTMKTSGAVFFDYDLDGLVDLFIANQYGTYGYLNSCQQDRLYRNLGNAVFVDVTEEAWLLTDGAVGMRNSKKPSNGATAFDWDNDGDQDIFVNVYGRQWNYHWMNKGDGTFVDIANLTNFDGDDTEDDWYEEPYRANGNTFGAEWADFDNDGDFDIYTVETSHYWAGPGADRSELLVNRGEVPAMSCSTWYPYSFLHRRDVGLERFHGFGEDWQEGDHYAEWLDFDNDGLQDLYVSSACYPYQFGRLYHQNADHTFTDVTPLSGAGLQDVNAVSISDYDRDGDMDMMISTIRWGSWTPYDSDDLHLFENVVGNLNHWLDIRLVGLGEGRSNAGAIGARVVVSPVSGARQMQEVSGGKGQWGDQNSMRLHFGLGTGAEPVMVSVRWPDGEQTTQLFLDVEPDNFITIVEGNDEIIYED